MITVNLNQKMQETGWFKLKDLVGRKATPDKTAFIGTVGSHFGELFFVSYSRIMLASDPVTAWDNPFTSVQVHQFVDVEINVL